MNTEIFVKRKRDTGAEQKGETCIAILGYPADF